MTKKHPQSRQKNEQAENPLCGYRDLKHRVEKMLTVESNLDNVTAGQVSQTGYMWITKFDSWKEAVFFSKPFESHPAL